MADSQDETDSMGDPNDDGNLTIRIPNPKVYMARQSLWIGRRGKPRCDHCRLNNLKCDRVLPACNHCSWASGRECKYTPLPTPAHRGIPRCDRCRVKNFKCDRNLPVCNHCGEAQETDCNYTPKKRHRIPTDIPVTVTDRQENYGTKTASFLISDMSEQGGTVNSSGAHSFYGQNVASSSSHAHKAPPSIAYERSVSTEGEAPGYPRSGRFTSEYQPNRKSAPRGSVSAPKPPTIAAQFPFITHSFPSESSTSTNHARIEPWSHPSFPPLPQDFTRGLAAINAVDMPNRRMFEDHLATFIADIMPDLRETAIMMPDAYSTVARALIRGDTSKLSQAMRTWISIHHACSGSKKYSLILLPRDPIFQMDGLEVEKLRLEYRSRVDGKLVARADKTKMRPNNLDPMAILSPEKDATNVDAMQAFDRVPLQPQVYDILAYAHRAHGTAFTMLFDIGTLGISSITWPMTELFIRLCPVCALRAKQNESRVKAEPPLSPFDFKR